MITNSLYNLHHIFLRQYNQKNILDENKSYFNEIICKSDHKKKNKQYVDVILTPCSKLTLLKTQ